MAALKREEDATVREAEHLEAEKLRHLRCAWASGHASCRA